MEIKNTYNVFNNTQEPRGGNTKQIGINFIYKQVAQRTKRFQSNVLQRNRTSSGTFDRK